MNLDFTGVPTLSSYPEDKQDILLSINNLDAWAWILGCRVELGEYFCNPFRKDNNPGCILYQSNRDSRVVLLSDRPSPEHDGITFLHALKYIYPHKNFYEQLKAFKVDYIAKNSLQIHQEYTKILDPVKFEFYLKSHARQWIKEDAEFWSEYEITKKQLESEIVLPVDWYERNSKFSPHEIVKYYPLDIAYSIRINNREKIYRPYAPSKHKWTSNLKKEDIGGRSKCRSNILWLTKSYKDYQVLVNQGCDSRFTLNEGTSLPVKWIQSAIKEFDLIIPLMDNDETGIRASKVYENQIKQYGGNAHGATLPTAYLKKGITDPSDLIKFKDKKQLNYELDKILENANMASSL